MSAPECRRVLEALLASVSTELAGQQCLDLTQDGLGIPWLSSHGAGWKAASDVTGDDLFGLVICEAATVDTGLRHVGDDGALLVLSPPAAASGFDVAAHAHRLTPTASVRSSNGDWHLCVPTPTSSWRYPLSVVVTCQDQARHLAQLLTALADDTSGVAWELVVVDRGSFDESGPLLRSLRGDVQLINRPRSTSATDGIDIALHACRGDLGAVIDPRLIPDPDWIVALLAAEQEAPQTHAFRGTAVPPIRDGADAQLSVVDAQLTLFAVRIAAYRARGGLDPTLDISEALPDLAARLGCFRPVDGLRATSGSGIVVAEAS
ncbi:MAG: glycosyltransferase [Nannocystaceae bacterium]